jgi:alkylation response protein AidB-like acyl-CoA dehydrogenase
MLMELERGRSLAMLAAMMVEEPDPAERAHNIAMAKVGVGQASRFVSQNAIQLHGGIGMTEEYAVGHYFRRCMVIEHTFGDTAHHLWLSVVENLRPSLPPRARRRTLIRLNSFPPRITVL